MADSIEGRNASYVGPDTNTGVRTGDRCYVLSDERSVVHVRWITGSLVGSYDELRPRELVPDLAPATASYDEFSFEGGAPTGSSGISVSALYERGGEVSLLSAMEAEGHLDNIKTAARQAVAQLRLTIAMDESWDAVRDSLGADEVNEVVASAIIGAITVAADEDEVSTDWDKGDDLDDFLD